MSKEEMDTRFFGKEFQERIPEADPFVKAVGDLIDKYTTVYGVERIEDLPPEGHEEFEKELLTINVDVSLREQQSE